MVRRLLALAVVAGSILTTAFLLPPAPAHACSCPARELTHREVMVAGGAVEGEVIGVGDVLPEPQEGFAGGGERRTLEVAVTRALGTDPGPTTTVVAYLGDTAACGLSLTAGQRVAYFADVDLLSFCSLVRDGFDAVVADAPTEGTGPGSLEVVTYDPASLVDPSAGAPPERPAEDGITIGRIGLAAVAVLGSVLVVGAVVAVARRSR